MFGIWVWICHYITQKYFCRKNIDYLLHTCTYILSKYLSQDVVQETSYADEQIPQNQFPLIGIAWTRKNLY